MLRKGQAAMEFLMTYGWAILVVLIAIGALAYFGVLNMPGLLPNKCIFESGFACGEFKMTAEGGGPPAYDVVVFFKNSAGKAITITGGDIVLTDTSAACTPVWENGALQGVANINMADGAQGEWRWQCQTITATTPAGAKFSGMFSFAYTNAGETLGHTGRGTLSGKVEA